MNVKDLDKEVALRLAARLYTRIRSLKLIERRGRLSNSQWETMTAFQLALQAISEQYQEAEEWISYLR